MQPEVQVGRELRGAALQPVVAVGVAARCPSVEPRVHALARAAASPGGNGSGTSAGSPSAPARGSRPPRTPEGRASCARRAVDLAPVELRPRAPERREDRVRLAALGPRLADVGDEQPGMAHDLDARLAIAASTRRSRAIAKPRHVGGEVQRARARLLRQRGQHRLRCAGAHDEVRAAVAQRGAQLAQAAEQEAPARAGLEAAVQQRLVEDEDGHDAVGRAGRGGQRRVVVDAQVAAEPDDRGLGHRQ